MKGLPEIAEGHMQSKMSPHVVPTAGMVKELKQGRKETWLFLKSGALSG